MLRATRSLFATAVVISLTLLAFLLSFTSIEAAAGLNKIPSDKAGFKKFIQNKQQQNAVNNGGDDKTTSTILRAARPTSTIPFLQRNQLDVLAKDAAAYKIGATCVALDIPTRKMWGWAPGVSGYCGETCFQASLILNGAWVSAERVRYADGNAELLIGVNDEDAAKGLEMSYKTYDTTRATAQNYLDNFVKPNIQAGVPVTMGFYELQKSGDNDYDHIMLIRGVELDAAGSVVGIYYNDWWASEVRYLGKYLANGNANTQFTSTRKVCTTTNAIAQPYNYCIPSSAQYAIALSGLAVANSAGIYTRVIDYLFQEPDWGKEDGLHQTPVNTPFTLVINGALKSGTDYTVLRFDSVQDLTDGSTPASSSYSWTYDFTYNGAENGEMTLTNVTTLLSSGEFYFVTVPKI